VASLNNILNQIKISVLANEPGAQLILFGSYARGDFKSDSDIDILVLIDKEQISRNDEKKIVYSLYDVELETGIIISPVIYTKHTWETRYSITPFYANVSSEGKVL
jgi:predicted nucleotidyltransferase